jgi:hypothetical protein
VQHQVGFGIDVANAKVTVVTPNQEWNITYEVDDVERVLVVTAPGPYEKLQVSTALTGLFYSQGHLALDEGGLVTLLRDVAAFRKAEKGTYDPGLAVRHINQHLGAGGTPFVYAGISSYKEFNDASRSGRTEQFDKPPVPIYSYYGKPAPVPEHWVSLTGPITERGDYYRLPVWTWNKAFDIEIAKARLGEYVYRWVLGNVT